jgi:peptide deformylase
VVWQEKAIRRVTRVLCSMLLAIVWAVPWAMAHEERVVIGQVQVIDVGKNVLVVQDPERDRMVRLVVDAETQVQRCRRGLALTALQVGAQVRVKYLDRPGSALEALSILILANPK